MVTEILLAMMKGVVHPGCGALLKQGQGDIKTTEALPPLHTGVEATPYEGHTSI